MLDLFKDLLVPASAIIISLIALNQSKDANNQSKDANTQSLEANNKSQQANDIANKISTGQIELNISMMIKETENRTMDLAIAMSNFFRDNLTTAEEKQLEFIEKAYAQAIESNLNAYEEACAKYLDKKTDTERFKRMYSTPIRRLLDDTSLKSHFPAHNSSYKCILKVHKEWFDLEK